MDHRLVAGVEEALGWAGPQHLGTGFARGSLRDRELPARVLTPTRLLDLVMRRNLGNPQIRCFQDGKELHPGAYLHQDVGGGTGRDGAGLVHMGRLGNLLREGTTMVLDRADVFDPTLEVACRSLQWWSGERVTVNIYLTTNAADGFGLHWDDHDVLVVQLSGRRTGRCGAPHAPCRCTATPRATTHPTRRRCGPGPCAPATSCTSRAATGTEQDVTAAVPDTACT